MREPGFDVRRHTFTRAFRGFDPAEVEAVLQAVVVDFDEARATLRQLEQALAEASTDAEQLLQGERSVIRVMRSADEHARMCSSSAHRQAARVIEAAEEHARELLAGPEEDLTTLANEVRAMEQRRAHILSELAGLIDAMTIADGSNTLSAHAVLPMRARATAAAPDAIHADPVASVVVTGSSSLSSPGSEDIVSPRVATSAPVVVASWRQAAAPDSISGSDERTDAAAFDGERVVGPERRRLFPLSTRRAAMVAAAVLLSAAAIAWPSVQGSGRTFAPVAAAPVPKPPALAVHEPDDDPGSATPAAAVAEPAPIGPFVIALKSSRPCWVRVTLDGVAEELMLAAGDEIARTAKATIRVRIGDAAALSVEVNGHALPPLGRPGQVVDRTFTADALRK